ncbi:MAG: phage major capsid protein, partial [Acidobacteria bacterium]|nr:phage major capsid protein [Acidobacteriota bacterium]
EVTPATAEVFVAADCYTTLEALPARHRANASWTMGLPTVNTISRFFNPSGSEPPLIDGDRLLRKPFFEASSMGDTSDIDAAQTADNFILLCGDFKEYRIVDRVGSTLEFIPQLFATGNNRPSGQRGFVYWWRVGADVTHIDAFRLLNIATAA